MVNRRSEKLDRLLGKRVIVTLSDGNKMEGVLEFDRPYEGTHIKSKMYSLSELNNDFIIACFFKKTHVRSIREVKDDERRSK